MLNGRLSDLKIYSKGKPTSDWMDKVYLQNERVQSLRDELAEQEKAIRKKEDG